MAPELRSNAWQQSTEQVTLVFVAMGFFRFVAVGEKFDVDGYLSETGLDADTSWHRGDRRGDGEYPNCGFIKDLGDESVLDLHQQFTASCLFLCESRSQLERLKTWPGFEGATLQLSPEIKVTEGLICAGLFFPEEIVKLAGELQLSIGFSVRVTH